MNQQLSFLSCILVLLFATTYMYPSSLESSKVIQSAEHSKPIVVTSKVYPSICQWHDLPMTVDSFNAANVQAQMEALIQHSKTLYYPKDAEFDVQKHFDEYKNLTKSIASAADISSATRSQLMQAQLTFKHLARASFKS